MNSLPTRTTVARRALLILACLPVTAGAVNIRIVTYNTQDDVSSPTPTNALPYLVTVLEGVGQQQYVGDGILRLPDIIALQETTSNSTTVTPLVTDLNNYYGNPGLYNSSSYQATTSDGTTGGGGPNALIYNQTTMNLLASVGVGTPESGTNGEFRQVVRYEFQPIADTNTSNGIFYVYDSHAKSGAASTSADGSTDGALRNGEAQIIRNDEAANLPANAAVLYMGDFNMDGTSETAYQTLTTAKSPSGVNQGAGIDPLNPNNNTVTWGSGTLGILTEKDTSLEYRDDLQLMTSNVYNDAAGTLDYVAGSLHAFGNNGTTPYETNINSGSNTSLNDLVGPLTPSQVKSAENTNLGSDHLPVVADYTLATQANGIWSGGTGNWSNSSFWSNGVIPNSAATEVKIDNGNATASVVTLNQNSTVEDVTLDANDTLNISGGYTLILSGPNASIFNGTFNNSGGLSAANVTNSGTFTTTGTLTAGGSFNNSGTAVIGGVQNWSSGAVFTNLGGTALFNTDAGSASASALTLNVSGGTVILASTQHLVGLNISSGASVQVTSTGPRSLLVTSSPAIAGTLDLTNNDLDAANISLTTMISLLKQGYNAGSGYWKGTGIISSTAAGDTSYLTTLGVVQNNQSGTALFNASNPLDNTTPGAGDIIVRYTWYGDANLDGTVDGSDYSLIDSGYLSGATGWFNGDFNYDGVIDGSDYTLIDNAYNSQGAQLTAEISAPDAIVTAQVAVTSSAVPEPALTGLAGLAAMGLLRRRRRPE